MQSLFVLLVLVVLIGSLCGIIALSKISSLRQRLRTLEQRLDAHQHTTSNEELKPVEPIKAAQIAAQEPISVQAPEQDKTDQREANADQWLNTKQKSPEEPNTSSAPSEQQASKQNSKIIDLFKDNWMLWVGGLALALGGVFFVKYSLEAGLLPPFMRLIIGGLFGCGLIGTAEYLHRKNIAFTGFASYIPAALAGGGFISLFSLTLLALLSFELINPLVAFTLLTAIALSASWYALRFGPLLAILGIVGAYSVPIWLSSGEGNIPLLLGYITMVTLSASLVAKQVKRQWLWYIIWTAHLGLVLLVILTGKLNQEWDYLATSLYACISIWLLIIWPRLSWEKHELDSPQEYRHPYPFMQQLRLLPDNALLLVIIAISALVVFTGGYLNLTVATFCILIPSIVLLIAPLYCSKWDLWPLLSAPLLVVLLFSQPLIQNSYDGLLAFSGVLSVVLFGALLLFAYGIIIATKLPKRLSFSVFASCTVFVLVAASYIRIPSNFNHVQDLWLIALLASAAVLVFFADRSKELMQQFSYWCGANANITLACTLFLDKTSLTLALTIQLLSISFLVKRYQVPMPLWPIKLLVAGILVRLTEAPWLENYQDASWFDIHWTTWFYPLAISIFWISLRLWRGTTMAAWLQGALLHLIALFVTTQTSLYLVGGMPDIPNMDVTEKIIMSMNWALLGCVYLYRMRLASKGTEKLYQIAGIALLALSALLQVVLFIGNNPFLYHTDVGSSVLFSWLWLWWALPIAVLFWLHKQKLISKELQLPAWIAMGILAILLINGLIRQYWQGNIISLSRHTGDAELYTYSVIWLLMGACLMAAGVMTQRTQIQKAGIGLLAVVIIKVFLVDMANLQGLLRALSFIGLGLCLMALSWLFQRFLRKPLQ